MHSANRAAIPRRTWRDAIATQKRYEKPSNTPPPFSRCRRRAYYPFSHPFSRLPPSLSSVLVCMSVRDHRCPWMGFFLALCFHPKQILACEPDSSRHNKLCAMWNTGPGRQAARSCNVQEDECRPPALFLSLPPQVWKIAFYTALNQKLTLPSCTAATDGGRAHLTSTKHSPRWSRGKDEGGLKTSRREGEK